MISATLKWRRRRNAAEVGCGIPRPAPMVGVARPWQWALPAVCAAEVAINPERENEQTVGRNGVGMSGTGT